MHYAENECGMPIRLHCNELRALCLTTNVLCRTAEFGALLLKCVLIVNIWPEKGVFLLVTGVYDIATSYRGRITFRNRRPVLGTVHTDRSVIT